MPKRRVNRLSASPGQSLVNRGVLSAPNKEQMMAILCRNKEAYAKATTVIDPEQHFVKDPINMVVWHALNSCITEDVDDMPGRNTLTLAIDQIIETRPDVLTQVEVEQVNDFLTYAYDPDTFDNKDPNDKYHTRWGIKTLQQFLEERVAQTIRENVRTQSTVPMDLPDFVGGFQDEINRINALSTETSNRLFGDANWDERPPIHFRDTGISFLQKFLGDGQVDGEVYGVLGPFGSCKTTLSVMIGVKTAQAAYAERRALISQQGEEAHVKPRISFIVTYEDGMDDLRLRILGFAADIPRGRMEKLPIREMSTSDDLQPYEQEQYKKQISAGEPVFGEQERANVAMTWLDEHLCVLDMTQPGRGSGGVQEISYAINDVLRDRDGECGSVVIDYAGAMVKRQLAGSSGSIASDDASLLRHRMSECALMAKNQIADRFKCSVWLMHQLSGDANSRGATARMHHTDAAEAKNFAENLNFCFVLGNPTGENLLVMACTKHRRQPPRDSVILQIQGDRNRVLDKDKHYMLAPNRNMIMPRSEVERVAGPPAPSQGGGSSGGLNDDNPVTGVDFGEPEDESDDDDFHPDV